MIVISRKQLRYLAAPFVTFDTGLITVPRGIPSAHMHWASISDLATLGMWADPGSYAWYVGGPR